MHTQNNKNTQKKGDTPTPTTKIPTIQPSMPTTIRPTIDVSFLNVYNEYSIEIYANVPSARTLRVRKYGDATIVYVGTKTRYIYALIDYNRFVNNTLQSIKNTCILYFLFFKSSNQKKKKKKKKNN